MVQFQALLEVRSGSRVIVREFKVDLPLGCGGVELVRAAEAYARSRGWVSVTICTGANGTVLPEISPASASALRASTPVPGGPLSDHNHPRRSGEQPPARASF